MLIYDVTYYDRSGYALRDYDTDVSNSYLETIPSMLKQGERAYAHCRNNPHEDREITQAGVRAAK